jgi:DNA (cytosine-5)-methyltransferase 1
MFGLGVWRHRNFETSFPILAPQCRHDLCPRPIDVTGTGSAQISARKKPTGGQSRKPRNLAHAAEVMGIDWMSRRGICQAIPPAYSEFIARAYLRTLDSTTHKERAGMTPPQS